MEREYNQYYILCDELKGRLTPIRLTGHSCKLVSKGHAIGHIRGRTNVKAFRVNITIQEELLDV